MLHRHIKDQLKMEELSNIIREKLEKENIVKARFGNKTLNDYLRTYPKLDFKTLVSIQLLKFDEYNTRLFVYLIEYWKELETEDIQYIISKVNDGDLLLPLVRFFTYFLDINLLFLIKNSSLHVNDKLYIFHDYDYVYSGTIKDKQLIEYLNSIETKLSTFILVKGILQTKYQLTPLDKTYIQNSISDLKKEKFKEDGIIRHYKNELYFTVFVKFRVYCLNLIRWIKY